MTRERQKRPRSDRPKRARRDPKPATCAAPNCPDWPYGVAMKGRTVCESCAATVDRRAAELREKQAGKDAA